MRRTLLLYCSLALLSAILATLGCGRKPPDSETNLASNSTPSPNAQIPEELKNFSAQDLLVELRARESRLDRLKIPKPILQDRADQKRYQPPLREPKLNPRLSTYSTAVLIQALQHQQQVIYGVDGRMEIVDVPDPKLREVADSVVSFFKMDAIDPLPDGQNSELDDTNFGSDYMLCADEPFRKQPCSAFCSGVLVAPDIVATAGHCVDTPEKGTPPATEIKFVFGYRMIDRDHAQTIISNSEIYLGKEVIARVYTTTAEDWALIRLDRPVVGHNPLPVRRSSAVADNEDVYVIGYPRGIPEKYAGGSNVRDNTNPLFFVANLDTFAGNSGSPVFNKKTHEVEGIFVRGEIDFVHQDPDIEEDCWISLVCPNTGCRGQDCMRITLFAHLIPDSSPVPVR